MKFNIVSIEDTLATREYAAFAVILDNDVDDSIRTVAVCYRRSTGRLAVESVMVGGSNGMHIRSNATQDELDAIKAPEVLDHALIALHDARGSEAGLMVN